MKKTIIFLVIVVCGLVVKGQRINEASVPADVKNKFVAMYPNIKERKWDKEEGKFEVSFKNNKEKTSLLFDANGTHIQTEVNIAVTSLPPAVNEYVSKNLKEKEIDNASRITAADGTITYEAEIDDAGYFFDANGKFLYKQKEDDDDDDEKDR